MKQLTEKMFCLTFLGAVLEYIAGHLKKRKN